MTAPPYADGEPGDHRADVGQLALELLGVPNVLKLAAAVGTARRQRCETLPVDRTDWHCTMAVAPVVLPGTTTRTGGFLCRVTLRERSRLTFRRSTRLLQELLQFGDTGTARGKRLGQLGDPCFEADDGSCQLGKRAGVVARGGVARRNSPRYARSPIRWWTPLSKYTQSLTGTSSRPPKVGLWEPGEGSPSG
jgi:hypothetical protein